MCVFGNSRKLGSTRDVKRVRALRIGMTCVQEGQEMGRLEDGDKDQRGTAWTIWYLRYSTRAQEKMTSGIV